MVAATTLLLGDVANLVSGALPSGDDTLALLTRDGIARRPLPARRAAA